MFFPADKPHCQCKDMEDAAKPMPRAGPSVPVGSTTASAGTSAGAVAAPSTSTSTSIGLVFGGPPAAPRKSSELVFFDATCRPAMPNTVLGSKALPSLVMFVNGHGFQVGVRELT